MERIVVYPDNTAAELAQDFALAHGLDSDTTQRLNEMLDQ